MRFPTQPTPITGECQHYAVPGFGHNQLASADDADKRMANGETQRRCAVCERWVWESFWPEGVW